MHHKVVRGRESLPGTLYTAKIREATGTVRTVNDFSMIQMNYNKSKMDPNTLCNLTLGSSPHKGGQEIYVDIQN